MREEYEMGQMAVMGREGDTKLIWDKNQDAEVENAKATFDRLTKAGYMAYSVKGRNGEKDEQIRAFDPDAERIILAPPLQGG
jgi:hypothetical protein